MSLYTINQQLMATFDADTGEILDEAAFEALQLERHDKIEQLALWHKSLLAEAEAIRAERGNLIEREGALRRKAERLKEYLAHDLNGKKFETARVAISWRKSQVLEYDGTAEVPDEYLKYKAPEIDKIGIKQAIKGGATVAGFEIVENNNIGIK